MCKILQPRPQPFFGSAMLHGHAGIAQYAPDLVEHRRRKHNLKPLGSPHIQHLRRYALRIDQSVYHDMWVKHGPDHVGRWSPVRIAIEGVLYVLRSRFWGTACLAPPHASGSRRRRRRSRGMSRPPRVTATISMGARSARWGCVCRTRALTATWLPLPYRELQGLACSRCTDAVHLEDSTV